MSFIYEHKTEDFRCSAHPSGTYRLEFKAHLHRHLELVLLCEGNTVAFADTECCRMQPGDAFLAFPNVIHRYISSSPEECYLIIVNPDLMPELRQLFFEQLPESAHIKGAANDPELLALAAQLSALPLSPSTPLENAVQHGLLLALFGKLLSRMRFLDAPADSSALRTVLAYCNANYQKEISLSALEETLHISKYYISHLFSDKLHISFNNYINSLRVSFACRYLQYSDNSITEISNLVGFGTQRTFNRVFRDQMGCTPLEYRRQFDKEMES